MNKQLKSYGFRSPDFNNYPELGMYNKHQIYDGFIGCGGLFLASKMIKKMNLKSGDIVLDLGCGLGAASVYMAKNFDITILSVDLWNSPDKLIGRMEGEKLLGQIIPLQLDITQIIPFPNNYFDAVFSMNSLFMFGGNNGFLTNLLNTLKSGGTFCLGSECFSKEPNKETAKMFNFDWKWNVWDDCFSKYHSPGWWKSLFEETNKLRIDYCQELEDAMILWEDAAINYNEYFGKLPDKDAIIPQEKVIELIQYGKYNYTYLSIFILCGVKIPEN